MTSAESYLNNIWSVSVNCVIFDDGNVSNPLESHGKEADE